MYYDPIIFEEHLKEEPRSKSGSFRQFREYAGRLSKMKIANKM